MHISDVLRVKGTDVVTIPPDTKVRRLLAVLAEHRIGAVVVSHDGVSVDGIAGERDIVRALAKRGAAVMSEPVTAICTVEVRTVTPQAPVEEVVRMMTEHRVQYAPVAADGGRPPRARRGARQRPLPRRRGRDRPGRDRLQDRGQGQNRGPAGG